jgi:GH24 family phage-related lysozyme (muramidase)
MKLGKDGRYIIKCFNRAKLSIEEGEEIINNLVKVKLKQCQFDALVSLVCDMSEDLLKGSRMLERINNNNFLYTYLDFLQIGNLHCDKDPTGKYMRQTEATIFNSTFSGTILGYPRPEELGIS